MPSKSQAKDRIKRVLHQIPDLIQMNRDSQEFIRWQRNTEIAITSTFGDNSRHSQDFTGISFSCIIIRDSGIDQRIDQRAYQEGLERAKATLESMLEEIDEYWSDDDNPLSTSEGSAALEQPSTNEIFVVHGRDEGTKNIVARYLETLNLEPVILQEQPNEGRTIIEKFEEYAQVGFAVVLCTPDDMGALETERENPRPRPRQNVVLEWGFFLGKIGRDRVCALVKGDVEIPSDYAGVIYINLDDSDGWKLSLARELRNAGVPVDMNLLA